MPRTPDRMPGASDEEAIFFEDTAVDPTVIGEIRRNGSALKAKDGAGVFDLRSGSGLSESTHETLDTLVHEINEDSYEQYVYTGNRVDAIVTWTSAAMTLKIREEQYTYSGNQATQIVTIQYDGAGVEKERNTETLAYTGNRLDSNTRTHTP